MRNLLITLLLLSGYSVAQCTQGSVTNLGTCPNPPVDILFSPLNPSVPVGSTVTFTTQWILADQTVGNVMTSQCNWSSSDPTKVTIPANSPVAKMIAAGSATVSCLAGPGSFAILESTVVTSGGGGGSGPTITNPVSNGCATPCPISGGTNGVAYSFTFAAVSPNTPLTWSVSAGSFAACFSTGNGALSSTGILSATAGNVTTGVCTPTVQVTDSLSNTTTLQVTLTISSSAACGTPPNYCARHDTTIVSGSTANSGNPPANLIGLNGAGNCSLDDMNSGSAQAYLCRVTDYAMGVAHLPLSTQLFVTPSSSTTRTWNSNTTVFGASDLGGFIDFFSYTAGSPPSTAFLARTTQDVNGLHFNQPEFSTTAPLKFFSVGFNGTGNVSTLNSYVSAANLWTTTDITGTVLLNPQSCPSLTTFLAGPLGPTWNKYIANGGNDGNAAQGPTPAVAGDYRYQQDKGSLVVVYDPSQGSSPHCAWVDFKTGKYCAYNGTCGSTTGFGPLPPPVTTWQFFATGGSLPCNHSYFVQQTYTLVGNNTNYGGESTPDAGSTLTFGGGASTCYISATPPVANPGGGTGINLTDTATGFNVYACDRTSSPGCTPVLQTNSTNPSGALALPVISSITGCTAGSATVTYYVVARNAGGTSPPSVGVAQASVLSTTAANSCTVNFSSVANATSYDLLLDTQTMTVATGSGGCIGAACSLKSTGTLNQYVAQTVPITTTPTIKTLLTTTTQPPTVNSAGVNIHNIRLDPTGLFVTASVSDYLTAGQNSPVQAPVQFLWQTTNPSVLIPMNNGAQSTPYVNYAQSHWTYQSGGIEATWPTSTTKLELVLIPLSNSAAVMNAATTFLCNGGIFTTVQPNAPCNLDTESGDMHLSGNFNGLVLRSTYRTSGAIYALPGSLGRGEIDGWRTSDGTMFRFCHTWASGNSFFDSPRASISQDGTVALFASDMQVNGVGSQGTATAGLGKTDGTNGGGTACTLGSTCRYDIFICQLK